MLYGEIRPRMKDNTLCKTKLENYKPVIKSSLLLKVFEYMLLPLLTYNFKLCDQQLWYRNQFSCTYKVIIMKKIYNNITRKILFYDRPIKGFWWNKSWSNDR